ncbi:hypothetical protein SAMN05216188_1417 [Lentzea xinjiangensis]|uniref:Uncharacterized protein n=1 Tax=Lentzea xinjiangensis TaxID=402600 RepID=A0A1H9WS00_9PSEU|nr:hypothetical protein [Lentzea xinjiangensis]SES36665.1 hypothetical protein SAMN05216188_1417 [Lentzea xinjiangensis]
MTRSRTRRRGSLTGFLSDIVDDTKEFVDDLLDRDDDYDDRDRRGTSRRTVRYNDEDRDLEGLREQLDRLGQQIDRLIQALQPTWQQQQQSK